MNPTIPAPRAIGRRHRAVATPLLVTSLLAALACLPACDGTGSPTTPPPAGSGQPAPTPPNDPANPPPTSRNDGTGAPSPSATAEGSAAGADVPGLPGFAPHTERQEELRGVADFAFQTGRENLAIAALIALTETPEASGLRGSGSVMLAELYVQESNFDQALAILDQVEREFPPVGEFRFIHGRTLVEAGRVTEGERYLREAIALKPEILQSYMYLGSVLVSTLRQEEAGEVYAAYERILAQMSRTVLDQATPLETRLRILEELRRATPDERIDQTLLALLDDPQVAVAGTALQALAVVGGPNTGAALEAFAQRTEEPELARLARMVAAQIAMQR